VEKGKTYLKKRKGKLDKKCCDWLFPKYLKEKAHL
jgi:hypothetical protein